MAIQQEEAVARGSSLAQLSPFLDSDRLRMGGRLKHALLTLEASGDSANYIEANDSDNSELPFTNTARRSTANTRPRSTTVLDSAGST